MINAIKALIIHVFVPFVSRRQSLVADEPFTAGDGRRQPTNTNHGNQFCVVNAPTISADLAGEINCGAGRPWF
jgi:hypothetical protein